MTRPVVAIVGRPNVGKSTLFNRLAGERLAIVEDLPGTTRDRVYADISWEDRELTIIDTGGLEQKPESDIRQKVQAQAGVAIGEADVTIFMVDAAEGVTLPDREVAESLRLAGKPLVLAVNKADNEKRLREAFQFHELGIGEPLAMSAIHGTGVADVMDAVCDLLPHSAPAEEEPGMLKVAIVGRPNAGKSMLLNALLGQERAIVSETPGTTRDAVDTVFKYKGEHVLFIDTAGIRRRGRVEGGVERYSVMRALRAIARADVALLVTEAAEVLTAQDAHIAGYIHQAHKGMVVVVNKWDLAGELDKDIADCTGDILRRLKFFPGVPVLFVSALEGSGIDMILPAAIKVFRDRQKRVPTAALNEEIQSMMAAHSPPSVQGRRLKISYVTQAEVSPPTFVFFVNDPRLVHFSYQRYLENKLREAFDFGGTPLKLVFKRKGKR